MAFRNGQCSNATKGFGFIPARTAGAKDVFVHISAVSVRDSGLNEGRN